CACTNTCTRSRPLRRALSSNCPCTRSSARLPQARRKVAAYDPREVRQIIVGNYEIRSFALEEWTVRSDVDPGFDGTDHINDELQAFVRLLGTLDRGLLGEPQILPVHEPGCRHHVASIKAHGRFHCRLA